MSQKEINLKDRLVYHAKRYRKDKELRKVP